METVDPKQFEDLIALIERLTNGDFKTPRFEAFMRVGNPPKLRQLAVVLDRLFNMFESREQHLKMAVDELQTTRNELEELNNLLDSKVRERTKALVEANALLESLSVTDSLTGINNRRNFDLLLVQETARARRYHSPLCGLMLDIDFFKRVNDTYGHQIGDEILRFIGLSLRTRMRSHDISARYGGEEFVILLPETAGDAAFRVAEKLRKFIAAKPVPTTAGPVSITVSLGVAEYLAEQMKTPEALVAAVDKALYEAKRSGRNRTVVFNSPQVTGS